MLRAFLYLASTVQYLERSSLLLGLLLYTSALDLQIRIITRS